MSLLAAVHAFFMYRVMVWPRLGYGMATPESEHSIWTLLQSPSTHA